MNRKLAVLLASSLFVSPALAAGIEADQPYLIQTRQAKPVQLQHRAPLLEELVQRSDLPYSQLQPIPLKGVRIQGLQPKSVEALGWNYFVVVDNPSYTRMADIYRDSRLAGKSNFVTADSIIHPYLAFSNRVLTDAITTKLVPDLQGLLAAMNEVSINDYRTAEDGDVREDISRNIAFLSVALKLLNPRYEIPEVADVPKLANTDLANIFAGKVAESAIFDRSEDFSQFKPYGFLNANDQIRNYYRCREWLSHMSYPIVDISGLDGQHSNNFRRSVLLFRALDRSKIEGRPGLDVYNNLLKASTLLGTQIDNLKERTLYPHDYKTVFQDRASDLHVTLTTLAEPLFRTKLMLAIRKQKPVNISAASIFDLDDGPGDNSNSANFRLFPVISQPEQPWFRLVARTFPSDSQSSTAWPVGLLNMYAWGSPMAGNVLADSLWTIDPKVGEVLPELVKCVARRQPGGQMQPVESRAWKILSTYFRPLPDGVPKVLGSESWLTRRLASAAGGWVDSQCALAPSATDAAANAAAAASDTAGGETPDSDTADGVTGVPTSADVPAPSVPPPRRISKAAPYHYLEPSMELYRLLEQDAVKIQTDLTAMKYMPEVYRTRFADFTRLFQRLQKISEVEMRGSQLTVMDKRLLGSIDQILDKVDVPLPAVIAVEAPQKRNSKSVRPEDRLGKGMNLAIGRPGMLYVIYQNPHTMEWTLGRGAVYSYYEMPAPLLTDSMWNHKIEAGFVNPLPWTMKYIVVQKEERKPNATAAAR